MHPDRLKAELRTFVLFVSFCQNIFCISLPHPFLLGITPAMKTFRNVVLLWIATGITSMSAQTTNSPVIAPGAKLEKLSGEFKFTEGPTSDTQGNVFFTDQPNNRIMKWSLDGKL